MQEAFEQFVSERFPVDAKRGTSGVIRAAFAQKASLALTDTAAVDNDLRFYVKNGYRLWVSKRSGLFYSCCRSLVGFKMVLPNLKWASPLQSRRTALKRAGFQICP